MAGRQVAQLADGAFTAGEHAVDWNGRDDAGSAVGSGIYFYRLDADGLSQTRKTMLIK